MDMQTVISMMSKEWELDRSKNMVTIIELVSMLSEYDENLEVLIDDVEAGYVYPTGLSSYRGYYTDIQIEFAHAKHGDINTTTVGNLISDLSEAIGKTYTGYKGGDFTMSKITPVWIDNYGRCRNIVVTHVDLDGMQVIIRTMERHDV